MNITELAIYKNMFSKGGTGGGGSGVIEVTELPTENIDTEAFYLCNGEYYKYSSGVGNTWVFNEVLTDADNINCIFNFEFEGYPDTRNGIQIYRNSYGGSVPHLIYATDLRESWGSPKTVVVYDFRGEYSGTVGWLNDKYRNITIKEMPTDETFLAWLNANAKPASGWVKVVGITGTLPITQSGEYDVSEYERVVVDIETPTNITIPVDELPVDNINFEAVYIYDGDLYCGTKTFVIKDEPSMYEGSYADGTSINISSNFTTTLSTGYIETFYKIVIQSSGITYFPSSGSPTGVYDAATSTWSNEAYKTITFDNEPTDEALCSWLKENATIKWDKYSLVTE